MLLVKDEENILKQSNYKEVIEFFDRMAIEKQFDEDELFDYTARKVKNYKEYYKIRYVGGIVKELISYIITAKEAVAVKLLKRINEDKLFINILVSGSTHLYKYVGVCIISNKEFFQFYEIVEALIDDIYDRMCIYNQIFLIISGNIQGYLISLNEKYRYLYSTKELLMGIFEGYVYYDSYIHQRIRSWILKYDEDRLIFDRATEDNPIYMVLKLFCWGFISKGELAEYNEFSEYSQILFMCINIEEADVDKISDEWMDILNSCIKLQSFF